MKFSDGGIKTLRDVREPSRNAELLIGAGYVDQLAAGIYTFLPLGKRVLDKISNIIREEMNSIGGVEITMPVLQPGENWKKTGRWDTLDVLYRFNSYYTKTDYALGPTHEEVVTPLAKKYISSYKDLPLYLYQIQTKFRDEKRAKSGLLRNREFLMKDLYSFHKNQEDLDEYYEKAKSAYTNIFKRCGIGSDTYVTYATGGSFSKYSHEFQTECEAGEDIIYLCKKCKVAINKEIIHEGKVCPECKNKELSEIKAIEVGNIFKLGTKFSDVFELNYKDKEDKLMPVVMGCYGIGPGRVMGAIVEKFNDEMGIIWPKNIAPFDVHLIDLDGRIKEAKEIYEKLTKAGYEVLWDNRGETAGIKLKDADLIGIPVRIVISDKTVKIDKIEVKERSDKDVKLVSLATFLKGK
jgi:prolyl-tRNA synthetase